MSQPDDPEALLKSLRPCLPAWETAERVTAAVERRYRESRVFSPALGWTAAACAGLLALALGADPVLNRIERGRLVALGIEKTAALQGREGFRIRDFLEDVLSGLEDPGSRAWLTRRLYREKENAALRERRRTFREVLEDIDAI